MKTKKGQPNFKIEPAYLVYYGANDYGEDNIKKIKRKYNILRKLGETKPLWVTETSLLCNEKHQECGNDFLLKQADYFDYAIEICKEYKIDVMIWFTLCGNGWLDSDMSPGYHCDGWKPVYFHWLNYLGSGRIEG